jgi:hypothetical protein
MTTPIDPRAEPEEKPTVELEQVPKWAVELTSSVKAMAGSVSMLVEDGKGNNLRFAGIEGRLARLESPTNPPPPPFTSEMVRGIVDDHPSKTDMEHEARIAATIVRQKELEDAVHETKALAVTAVALGESNSGELAKQSLELEKQSKRMGIGVQGLQWAASKDGRASVMRLVTLVGVVYAALKTAGIIK